MNQQPQGWGGAPQTQSANAPAQPKKSSVSVGRVLLYGIGGFVILALVIFILAGRSASTSQKALQLELDKNQCLKSCMDGPDDKFSVCSKACESKK